MKEGWKYVDLSSVCKVQNGYAFNSKLFNENKEGLPLIRIRDIKRGYSRTFTVEECAEDFYVENGDMLIGMDGDFNVGEWKGGHACLNQRVCKLIPTDKILGKFIFYVIPKALQEINSKTAFSTVKHLSSKQVNAIQLPSLSLSEQQDIVRYLDESFAKIDALKVNAEKSLADAKALFQAELKKAMEPKEGWEEKKLGELAENLRTGLNPRTHFKLNTPDATGYYITVRELKGFTFQVDEKTDRINQHAIERINQRSGLKIGDILYSGTGTIGRTSIVTENPTWWNIKEGVYAITPKAFIDSKYLIYVLRCETIHKRILEKASGTTVKSIPMRELVNITIPLTSLTDQQSIVTHLDALSAKVTQLQQNLEKIKTECDALKQALLKQVFK